MAIIDNSIVSFCKQMDSGIHLPSFFGELHDCCLLSLLNYLKSIANSDDLSEQIKNSIGLSTRYKIYLSKQSKE